MEFDKSNSAFKVTYSASGGLIVASLLSKQSHMTPGLAWDNSGQKQITSSNLMHLCCKANKANKAKLSTAECDNLLKVNFTFERSSQLLSYFWGVVFIFVFVLNFGVAVICVIFFNSWVIHILSFCNQ